MREIKKLIFHCSATIEGQNISAATIKRWHVRDRGWSDIGTGTNMDIESNITGTTKWSSNNSWSINMSSEARKEDTP